MKISKLLKLGILNIILLFCVNHIQAQEYSFGIKGGLTYSLGNDGSEITGRLGQFSAESDFGYHAGVFGEIRYDKFFFRPELYYGYVASNFVIDDETLEYNIKKLNIPFLIGYNILGPIEVYAGPSYQKILDSELDNVKESIEINQKNLNAHFGIKLVYEEWEVDLRYEYVPASNGNQIVDIENIMDNAYFDDGRLNNLMLTLNYKFLDTHIYNSTEVIDN